MGAMRPEHQLLLYTARTRADSRIGPAIDKLPCDSLDWDFFRQTAIRHGVASLVYEFLRTVCPERVPPAQIDLLRQHAVAVAGRNLLLASQMAGLIEVLASRGVSVIPYKGPVLAAMAYRNLALREFADLDFIVAQRDLQRAWETLETEGYKPEEGSSPAGNSSVAAGQYAFFAPRGACLVELHTELTLRHFPRALDPLCLSRSLSPVTVNGNGVLTFSPEDTFVFLSVHGAKDFWARVLWIADVAELVQIPEGFNWEKALTAANRLGCGRMARVAILLANDLLDAPIPPAILDHARADRKSRGVARTVSEWLFNDQPAGLRARAQYRMRLVDGFWPGVHYVWRLGTQPTGEDGRTVRLPRGLRFLYALIRPIRLLGSRGGN